jgi:hypothetical protein
LWSRRVAEGGMPSVGVATSSRHTAKQKCSFQATSLTVTTSSFDNHQRSNTQLQIIDMQRHAMACVPRSRNCDRSCRCAQAIGSLLDLPLAWATSVE